MNGRIIRKYNFSPIRSIGFIVERRKSLLRSWKKKVASFALRRSLAKKSKGTEKNKKVSDHQFADPKTRSWRGFPVWSEGIIPELFPKYHSGLLRRWDRRRKKNVIRRNFAVILAFEFKLLPILNICTTYLKL